MVGHTPIDWGNYCRKECQKANKKRETEIGGLDSKGIPIVVEIDESLFFNRKYHRGSVRSNHWVFGGIERGMRKCFAVEVSDRKRDTLEDVIKKYILLGSCIMSDMWAAYAHIQDINNGIYMHAQVNHSHHLSTQLIQTSTQNLEKMWMWAKRKLKR